MNCIHFRLTMGVLLVLSLMMSSCYRPSAEESFKDLQALVGEWQAKSGVLFNESWTYESDSLLSGFGYSMKEQDTLFIEKLKIYLHHDTVYYAAFTEENNKYIDFKLVSAGRSEWVFENPKHDYPNIISYSIKNDTLLHAFTANIRSNKKISFDMVKIQ